ncbi:MAG: class II aldolase/adducin family protein [Actinomycetota bacterium]|nr:class II aldolase/adducin family protein [Actinomycetota bacterium]
MDPIVLEYMREVLKTAQEMSRKGLVVGSSGNCSARVQDTGMVVITPTSIEYELMLFEDMCIVNMDGEQLEGRYAPSIEINMHLQVYRGRPDVGGIVHTHQTMATAVGVTGEGIPPILEEQVFSIFGGVELAKYALPGTKELAENAVQALANRNACLLAHHGVLAVGPKLRDALLNAEIVERAAAVYIFSREIGEPRIVPFMESGSEAGSS